MMRASVWLRLIGQFRPDIAKICSRAFAEAEVDRDFCRPSPTVFRDCPADSIDYAVMERLADAAGDAADAVVLALDVGWSDAGSWSALWEISRKDERGNVIEGDVVLEGATDTLALAQHRLLTAVGVRNLIIIETPDAVLVADKDRAQDVKRIADWLKREQRTEFRYHRRVHRPWGSYEGLFQGERFQVKRLEINPYASLSLQMHHHRAEHWVVVSGTARVTRDEDEFLLGENESTFIPLGSRHRLENPGKIPLVLIEVQSGAYLGEDDIVRFADVYNRQATE